MLRALLVASLMGAVLSTAPIAHAEPTAGLTITDVRLSRSQVAVTGLNTVLVTVEADGGFDGPSADPNLVLYATFGRDSGPGTYSFVPAAMTRYEGTTQHGKWRGVAHVRSTASGIYAVDGLSTGLGADGSLPNYTTVIGPKLTIKGTGQPSITARFVPEVVPVGQPYKVSWSVLNADTRKPYGTKLKVVMGQGADCERNQGRPELSTTTG